jgi:DNA-binding response OmpR family regulator
MNEEQPLVLVVDDDDAMVRLVASELRSQGFMSSPRPWRRALRQIVEQRPDILLLTS